MAENLILAKTAEEALKAKNSSSAFFAGGTEIERLGSLVHADTLILLKGVPDLDAVEASDEFLRIGALCTFEKALENDLTPDYLKTALAFMASRTKRNMATVGGNVAIFRCDSYLIPTLLASGAKLEILSASGEKKVVCMKHYAEDRNAFADSLITALLLPKKPVPVLSKRYANTAESHACLTISMGITEDGIRAGVAAKNAGIFHLTEDEIKAGGPAVCEKLKDDMFGSAAYKKYLLGVTLKDQLQSLTGGDAQ